MCKSVVFIVTSFATVAGNCSIFVTGGCCGSLLDVAASHLNERPYAFPSFISLIS